MRREEDRALPKEATDARVEAIAHLALNPTLGWLLQTMMQVKIVDALSLLSKREFENAYSALSSFDVLETLEAELQSAKSSWEARQKEQKTNRESIEVPNIDIKF